MKLSTLSSLVAGAALVGLSAHAGVTVKPRTDVKIDTKIEMKTPTNLNPATRSGSEVGKNFGGGSKFGQTRSADEALTSKKGLQNSKKLSDKASQNTCKGTGGMVTEIAKAYKRNGMNTKNLLSAAQVVNNTTLGAVVQACQAGEPITSESALINLGKTIEAVASDINSNTGSAGSVETWAAALRKAIPGLQVQDSIDRVKGLASSKCQILNGKALNI